MGLVYTQKSGILVLLKFILESLFTVRSSAGVIRRQPNEAATLRTGNGDFIVSDGFTQLRDSFFLERTKKLHPVSSLTLIFLLRAGRDHNGESFYSFQTIADLLNTSSRTVRRAFEELREEGLIETKRRPNNSLLTKVSKSGVAYMAAPNSGVAKSALGVAKNDIPERPVWPLKDTTRKDKKLRIGEISLEEELYGFKLNR